VPTALPPGAVPSVEQLASQSRQHDKIERFAKNVSARRAQNPSAIPKKLHRRVGKGNLNVTKASYNVANEITKLPKQIFNKLKSSL
jgi:hypothetical protein